MGTLSRGLYAVDKRTGGMRKLLMDGGGGEMYVNKIEPLSDGRYLIGTLAGIYVLKDGMLVQNLRHDRSKPWSLSGNGIHDIYEDKKGNVWVGTERNGVDFHSRQAIDFVMLQPDGMEGCQEGFVVTALAESADGRLWMGTEDGLLYACCFPPDGIPTFRLMNNTMRIKVEKKINTLAACGNEMWVGTFSDGIYVYERNTGRIRHYYKTGRKGSLKNNEILCICPDREGRVWIGTTTDLFLFHRETDSFEQIEGLRYNYVVAISENRDGNLWVATRDNGLKELLPSTKMVRTVTGGDSCKETSFFRGMLSDVVCGKDGSVWVASENGGVCRYMPSSNRCDIVDQSGGLPGVSAHDLVESQDGNIWVCTDRGVACIGAADMKVICSYVENGVWGLRGVIPQTGVESRNGTLFWGGMGGALAFVPESLAQAPETSDVKITGYTLFKKGKVEWRDVPPSVSDGKGSGTIRLQADESTFSIGFSPMDYANRNAGYYSYILEGASRGWVIRKGISEAVYHDLPPGRYVFRVGYSMDGTKWNAQASEVEVVVVPPWWRSSWAYGGYALLFLLSVSAAGHRWHCRQKRRNAVQAVMREARERENVYKAKMDFLAYMAHEVRTPFSIVLVALENLRAKWKCPPDAGRELELMGKAVGRLNRVVNDMLEFRALEADSMQADMRNIDFSLVLKMVCEAYSAVARKNRLDFRVEMKSGNYGVWADEEMLITVLSNLVNNALKYASHEVALQVGVMADGDEPKASRLCMRIANDGAKIPVEIRSRIFEPFVRERRNGVESTGLGLPLALRLVKKMGGSLRLVEDSHMTCFELTLLLTDGKRETGQLHTNGWDGPVPGQQQGSGEVMVLIAEDDKDLAGCIVNALSSSYAVVWVPDGEEAWSYLKSQKVDLVISDVMMPKLDGISLCRRLKESLETCHIPVILLTAKSFKSDYMEGVKGGADAYIGKPFSMEMLQTWALNLLKNRQRIRQRLQCGGMENVVRADFADADRLFFDRLRDIVLGHLDEDDFSLDALAGEVGMSRSTFHRKLKGLAGMTPNEFVMAIRLDKARDLLQERRYKVGEVCYMVGFKSQSHFVRSFEKRFGSSPKKYMER